MRTISQRNYQMIEKVLADVVISISPSNDARIMHEIILNHEKIPSKMGVSTWKIWSFPLSKRI